MAFIEDLSPFFDNNDFAITVTLTPVVGLPTTFSGIFDDEYRAFDAGEVDVIGSNPRLHTASTSVSTAKVGDTITANSKNYKIVNFEPDGTGITVIILEEA